MKLKFIYIFLLLIVFSVIQSVAKDCIPNRKFELIENGDFELGDTLFVSQLRYSPLTLFNREGCYAIGKNPKLLSKNYDSCFDHTSTTGLMLIANGALGSDTLTWGQKVPKIEKNTDYELRFWFASADSHRPAIIRVLINQDTLPQTAYFPLTSCNWQEFVSVWNSGNSDTAFIKFYNNNYTRAGNDYLIDDISFQKVCKIQVCADKDKSSCKNTPVQLGVNVQDGYPPYNFKWTPAIYLNNPNAQTPTATTAQTTTFFVEVTDARGCVDRDSLIFNIYDSPPAKITSDKSMPICPCDQAILSADPGYTYLWSTGDTTQSIKANIPTKYQLTITDKNGCTSTGSFYITLLPLSLEVKLDTLSAKIGDQVRLEIHTEKESNTIKCNLNNYTAQLIYRSSLLIPVNFNAKREILNGNEILDLNLNSDANSPVEFLFQAALGDSECTDIFLRDLKFGCDSVISTVYQGRFCLSDVCQAGGTRLFLDTQKKFMILENNIITKNEISLKYGLIEPGLTTISIYNDAGHLEQILINEYKSKGNYDLRTILEPIPIGKYFLIFKQNGHIQSEQFFKL